jgi:hypothetical protein
MNWDKIPPGLLTLMILSSAVAGLASLNKYTTTAQRVYEQTLEMDKSLQVLKSEVEILNQRSEALEKRCLYTEQRLLEIEERVYMIDHFLKSLRP